MLFVSLFMQQSSHCLHKNFPFLTYNKYQFDFSLITKHNLYTEYRLGPRYFCYCCSFLQMVALGFLTHVSELFQFVCDCVKSPLSPSCTHTHTHAEYRHLIQYDSAANCQNSDHTHTALTIHPHTCTYNFACQIKQHQTHTDCIQWTVCYWQVGPKQNNGKMK